MLINASYLDLDSQPLSTNQVCSQDGFCGAQVNGILSTPLQRAIFLIQIVQFLQPLLVDGCGLQAGKVLGRDKALNDFALKDDGGVVGLFGSLCCDWM